MMDRTKRGAWSVPPHHLLLILLLLIILLLVPGVSAVTYPGAEYSGYDIEPYVNATNFVDHMATFGNSTGTINISTAFYPPVGAVTETVWLPFEWAAIFMIVGFIALFLSATTPELRIIAGLIALYCFTVLSTSGPFVVYHGVEVIAGGTSATAAMGVVQPWQEIWLFGPWYVWGNLLLWLLALGNLIYSAWEVTHALITRGTSNRRSLLNDRPDRKV